MDNKKDRSLIARMAGNIVAGMVNDDVLDMSTDRGKVVAHVAVQIAEAVIRQVDHNLSSADPDATVKALILVARSIVKSNNFHLGRCSRQNPGGGPCDICVMRDLLLELP